MKRMITLELAAALLVTLFAGCAAQPDGADYAWQYDSASNITTLQESADGYWFVTRSGYLFFLDKAGGDAVFLCARPNCLHDGEPRPESCSAYIRFPAASPRPLLWLYEDRLWALTEDPAAGQGTTDALVTMDPDGQNRRTVCTFPAGEKAWMAIIHRGALYAVFLSFDEQGRTCQKLYRVRLNGKGGPETLAEYEPGDNINRLTALDGYLYYIRVRNTNTVRDTDAAADRTAERLDIRTGKRQTLELGDEDWLSTDITFADGALYVTQRRAGELDRDGTARLYRSGPDGSDPTLCIEGRGVCSSDGERIYCLRRNYEGTYTYDTPPEPSALVIYDLQGDELDRLPLDDLPCGKIGMVSVFPTAGDSVLFSVLAGDGMVYLYRFPKAGIGVGQLAAEPLGEYRFA